MYKPNPINTSLVIVGLSLVDLTEQLAENAHENWAALRISQGWQWGNKRNDEEKLHPDLVPYADLPESEKEYDRATAMETVKVLVKLGHL